MNFEIFELVSCLEISHYKTQKFNGYTVSENSYEISYPDLEEHLWQN
jgi:hypothetical protein